jgi:hypothetical protein
MQEYNTKQEQVSAAAIRAAEAAVLTTRTAHQQELDMLRLMLKKVSVGDVKAGTVGLIDEKACDVEVAPRDAFGIANTEGPCVATLAFAAMAGVNATALNTCVNAAAEHVGSRAMKQGQAARTKDGNVPFKVGQIMSHIGEIEGTSLAMESFVSDHMLRKNAEQDAQDAQRAEAAAKLKLSNEALPQLLIDTKAKIAAPPGVNKVGECRAYAKARLQDAKLLKQKATAERIQLNLKQKGPECIRLVTLLAHPVAAEPL